MSQLVISVETDTAGQKTESKKSYDKILSRLWPQF